MRLPTDSGVEACMPAICASQQWISYWEGLHTILPKSWQAEPLFCSFAHAASSCSHPLSKTNNSARGYRPLIQHEKVWLFAEQFCPMKENHTVGFQGLLLLTGTGSLTWVCWEPAIETLVYISRLTLKNVFRGLSACKLCGLACLNDWRMAVVLHQRLRLQRTMWGSLAKPAMGS